MGASTSVHAPKVFLYKLLYKLMNYHPERKPREGATKEMCRQFGKEHAAVYLASTQAVKAQTIWKVENLKANPVMQCRLRKTAKQTTANPEENGFIAKRQWTALAKWYFP